MEVGVDNSQGLPQSPLLFDSALEVLPMQKDRKQE